MSAMHPVATKILPRRGGRYVPCVDGSELAELSSRKQHWSVQPCVRPLDAVHMTAGHNALRGSGPDQKLAFDNAMALVGCPDRRIDRLCITMLFALPTFTSRRLSGAVRITPQVRWVPCIARPWPSWPRPFCAILLASAMAATFVGRRASNAVSQGRCLVPWILA